jgi:NAD(P)-dependent dehydrogenase (short-subunit alcohol dehydrogenase family)
MRTVLVTGAGGGFGRALLVAFGERGWSLFPLVREPRMAEELALLYERCHPIIGDVSRDEVHQRISETLLEHTESLDLLVNNAGNIQKTPGVLAMTPDELVDHFQVHCVGVLRCVKATFPFLVEADDPLVVNVSSRRGAFSFTQSEPVVGRAYAYRIAKCAQNMLTVCLDQELRESGIRVFAVHPGRLRTSVAPPDADTEPERAAVALVAWIESIDRSAPSRLFDLMGQTTLDW